MNTSIINFDYKGNQIPFEKGKDVMVNLTAMAKPFPEKNLSQIINSLEIKEYINALTEIQNYSSADLLIVRKGGNISQQGTWGHRLLAIRVAQKLNPALAVWVDMRIEELLTTGVTTVSNDDEAIAYAMGVLQNRLAQAKADKQRLEQENSKLLPKAELADKVIATENKIDIGQASKILNLGYGRNTLFSKLRESGIFFKNRNEPKQQYVDAGYFELKEQFIERDNHPGFTIIKVLVTQKGLYFIHKALGGKASDGKLAKIA